MESIRKKIGYLLACHTEKFIEAQASKWTRDPGLVPCAFSASEDVEEGGAPYYNIPNCALKIHVNAFTPSSSKLNGLAMKSLPPLKLD